MVAMTDCNHDAKNIRLQLILGSSIVTVGKTVFDVSVLNLAGVALELFRVYDYASDVNVLKVV